MGFICELNTMNECMLLFQSLFPFIYNNNTIAYHHDFCHLIKNRFLWTSTLHSITHSSPSTSQSFIQAIKLGMMFDKKQIPEGNGKMMLSKWDFLLLDLIKNFRRCICVLHISSPLIWIRIRMMLPYVEC